MTRSERILGLIAAIIAIFVFVTGIPSLKRIMAERDGHVSPPASEAERRPDQDSSRPAIALTTFRTLPRFIYGCSAILSETKGQFMAREYIYADDTRTQGVIFIDGTPRLLKRVYRQPPPDYFSEYSDGEYTAILTIQRNTKGEGEAETIMGTLTITRKDGITRTLPVYGELAC